MNRNLGLVLLYLAITLALSSVDITYEWLSPLSAESGEKMDWYAVSGLRAGALFLGNHDTGPAMGLSSKLHFPHLPLLPFFAIGGPEGGVIFVAVWLVVGITCLIHILRFSQSKRASVS